MAKLWIASPCFFDVPSWRKCVEVMRAEFVKANLPFEPHFVLIDDSAGSDPDVAQLAIPSASVSVITMPYNLGHQAALVYALRLLGQTVAAEDLFITMDADGEDRPVDVPSLVRPLLEHHENLQMVALARRTFRRESLAFKAGYFCFRMVFRTLTGCKVRNGNFAAFRGRFLQELIFHPHFDQCYASAFISLPLQIELVPLPRGTRFFGESKMGYLNLVSHGLHMLMPFTEKIAIRGVIASAAIGLIGLLTFLVLIFSRPVPALVLLGVLCSLALALGMFALLFAIFSQSKAASLSRLSGASRNLHRLQTEAPS